MIFFYKRHIEGLREKNVFKLPFISTLKRCDVRLLGVPKQKGL